MRLDSDTLKQLADEILTLSNMNMICQCQVKGVSQGDIVASVKFIAGIFGVVA